jgi:glucosamine-6-phosphate deaminase
VDWEYFALPENKLGENAKIPLKIFTSSEEVFAAMANVMLELIEKNNEAGKQTVIICPVGPTGHYSYFTEAVNKKGVDLKNCWFFNMDEYLDENGHYISESSRLSFRGFMNKAVYSKIRPELLMSPEQRVFPNPECPEKTTALLEKLGGAQLALGGIGINGHIAFNEPQDISEEQFKNLPARTLRISPETRTANAIGDLGGAIELMPERCVTLGMREILGAERIVLGVFRDWHRAVVRRAAYGDISPKFPVSLCQRHKNAAIFVNHIAAQSAV